MKKKPISDDQLENFFKCIKIGHDNAIKPPKKYDQEFSSYVDKKNLKGDIVIKSNKGYYRPFPMDDIDSAEFSKYIESEYFRGMEIIDKCNSMTQLYSKIEKRIMKQWEA